MDQTVKTLRDQVADTLQGNIMPFWLKFQDKEKGGFYGRMTGDGVLVKDASKGGILNARILWSFSAAYRVLGNAEYLAAARNAYRYIIDHFIDHEFGGTFWEVDADGRPTDTKKQFYAIGFTIYGLSEYARAIAHHGGPADEAQAAIDQAVALFDDIEHHSRDLQYGGYIEACSREWGALADMRLSDLDANFPKSQNTHLHIIEPYTNLLRTLREFPALKVGDDVVRRLEAAVRHLIDIFCHRILNPETHHLDLFFEMDWTRGAGWLESYGHDIECSWLLHEAALVLADETLLREVEPIVRLVAKASEKGLNADGSMTHEANLDTGHVDADRHWWVQAETVVGFYNIWQHFGDEDALHKAVGCWRYIQDNLIDHNLGEWFWSRDPKRVINRKDDHAGFWKCPYHNSRMCLEIIERAKAIG